MTIMGSTLSLFGALVCSTGKAGDTSDHENEKLGAIIATIGTSCTVIPALV